jgi:galactokinase/mevalonate kinase-like predicted kinase
LKYFVQAPVRISLFGGGTDVGEYADKYGGVCMNMAINIHQEFTFETEDKGFYIPPRASIGFYKAFYD